jgi:hypothetical protein
MISLRRYAGVIIYEHGWPDLDCLPTSAKLHYLGVYWVSNNLRTSGNALYLIVICEIIRSIRD